METKDQILINFFTDIKLINDSYSLVDFAYEIDQLTPVRFWSGNSYPYEPEDLANPVPNKSGSFAGSPGESKTLVIYNNRNFNFSSTNIDKIEAYFNKLTADKTSPGGGIFIVTVKITDENGITLKSSSVKHNGDATNLSVSVDTTDISPRNRWYVHIEVALTNV